MKYLVIFLALIPYLALASQSKGQNRAIMLTPSHSTFSITVTSNPTTGYRWFLQSYDSNLIKPVSYKFTTNKNKRLMGAPGMATFTFKALKNSFVMPMTFKVGLIYARPWDPYGGKTVYYVVRTS